ncbi:MAG: T9SS type A sorting domain-containing protein [Saprospiraceae bacterium]
MKLKLFALCLLLVGFKSNTFSQFNWQTTNGPEGGTFLSIFDDGQYSFVADEYHFFRTSDGLSWEQLPHENIWPLATSPTKLAAGKGYGYNYGPSSGSKFVVSYDHGSTWIEGTMPPTTYSNFSSIAVCSHGVYVPDGYSSYILRTQDDGLTWDSIPAPGMYCYDVWAFEDRLYAEWSNKFWRLSLNGTDWEVVSPVFAKGDNPMSVFASDSLLFFATDNNLWCSSNSGGTWTKTPIQIHNRYDKFCKIGDRVYKCAGQTGIMYTDDFGHSWHELPVPNDFSTFDLATAGGQLLCGTYNKGVLMYDMPNQQLAPSNEGLNSATVYCLDSGNGQLWAACGNGVFAYNFAQETWIDKALLPQTKHNFDNVAVSPAGKIMASAIYADHFYLSVDDGASWATIVPSDSLNWEFVNINKIFWVGENILIKTEWGKDAWSTDLGQTWEFGSFPHDIVFFAGRYFGCSLPVGLVSSDDFGHSWHPELGPNVSSIQTLYATDDKLFTLSTDVAGRTQIHSTSDVSTWTYSNDGLPQMDIYDPVGNPYSGGIWHKGDRYYLHQSSVGFFTSLDTCKTWLPVERYIYGVLDAEDTTLYRGGFGGGVNKTVLPKNYGALSTGHVFKDDNNNSIWDPTEATMPNLPVSIKEPGAWYPYWFVYTGSDGRYAIGSSPGTIDTLRVNVPSAYVENINPPQHVVTNTGNDRNFGVHFKPNITDVSITSHFAGRPRPGFSLGTYVVYRNEGTIPASGTVSVKLDPKYQFISADPPPSALVGTDSLIWDFNQIPLFNQQSIHIIGKVDSTAALGSLFKMNGHIEPNLSDFMTTNNHFMRSDSVVGSYDPNEKRVEPAKGLTPSEIATGKELVYTVQFQNTGNFQADRVRITDLLDTALNASTLRLVASSHAISTFRLLPGNLLEVIFEQITLPDSTSNEPASHGFVSFAIQRKKAFHLADKIQNTAAIYFDFNEPVITNTVITPVATTIVSSFELHSTDTKNAGLMISPNPTAKNFEADTRGRLSGPGDIVLINAQGKICLSQQSADLSLPINLTINSLSNGAYIVRASGKQGILFGKLVIAR